MMECEVDALIRAVFRLLAPILLTPRLLERGEILLAVCYCCYCCWPWLACLTMKEFLRYYWALLVAWTTEIWSFMFPVA